MNVPANVELIKPELPPMPSVLMFFHEGEWKFCSCKPENFAIHMKDYSHRPLGILTPTIPREPMSVEDVERIEKLHYEADASVADIIRAVEAHHGIGREDGK